MKEGKNPDMEKMLNREKKKKEGKKMEQTNRPGQKNKKKESSPAEAATRRSEISDILRTINKTQHNDHYELRALLDTKLEYLFSLDKKLERLSSLDAKLERLSSIVENSSKDLDSKLEEEFVSLKGSFQSGMENVSDNVKSSPDKLVEKVDELQKALMDKTNGSVDVVSNGLSHIGEVFEKLEGSFKEEINALRETLQKVFEEMYTQFKESSKGLKELSSLMEKYVGEFKEEREKFDNRMRKEEARRLNDMAVRNFYGGKADVAIRQLKEAVLLDDASAEILTNLAVALSSKGKQKDARKIFERVLKDNPDMLEAEVGLGLIMFDRGNIDEAIEIFKEASKKSESEAFIYADLGYAYEQKEMIDKAVSNWEKALQIDPTLQDVGKKLKLYKNKEA